MCKKNLIILFLILVFIGHAFGQKKKHRRILKDSIISNFKNNSSVLMSYQNGYVFPTNDFVKGNNAANVTISNFQTFSLKFTKQTLGKKLWEQLYHYPEYGIGIYLADFYNFDEIGFPIAFYGYYTSPIQRGKKITLNYELGLGFAFNWEKYSPSNTYNNAIGAKYTSYIDLGLKTEYKLSEKIVLNFSFSLTHFSNGRLKSPNLGLNTISPKFGLKYNLNKCPPLFIKQIIPKHTKRNELFLSVFTGSKNIIFDTLNVTLSDKYEGETFSIYGISAVFNQQISYKSKIGLGCDLSYDGSINTQTAMDDGELEVNDGPFFDNLHISVFPSYELLVNKVSIVIQPGFYIYRKKIKNQSPDFYQRIGLKYNIYKKFYIGLNLRAYNFYFSDFIEWKIGYVIK